MTWTWKVLLAATLLLLTAACATNGSDENDAGGGQTDAGATPAVEADDAAAAGAPTSDGADAGADDSGESAAETEARSFAGTVPAPEFPPGADWLNVAGPLTLADLRGKVVLLDFWTYGCINCMHVIPDLKRLEEKYAEELVVVGVHSAKFDNEGDTENIRRIIQRYELQHPVINDDDFSVWNSYGARAWPTFVLIDPVGNIVGYHAGEGIYDLFDYVIGQVIAEFEGQIEPTPLSLSMEQANLANSPLLFPGKVLADAANDRLFIADSNHNRIVVTNLKGEVQAVIGAGPAGLEDGDYESARFFRPQGLALDGDDTLYVADTSNHVIRRVDLAAETVTTVAGTGEQVFFMELPGPAATTPLNSPWDVLFHDGLLYIAMAGNHQVWVYDPAAAEVRVFAGSGREELSDGRLARAGLNQPSGLAHDGEFLYIADSEASAVRRAPLDGDGELATLVGTGLFDFGDVDGIGDDVRLQHPLGVAHRDGLLFLADTYNSKLKTLDPSTREALTFAGGDEPGWRDGEKPLFDEPGGLSIAGATIYVADTNNHVIRRVDADTGETDTLVLVDTEALLTRAPEGAYGGKVITLDPQTVAAGEGTVALDVAIPDGYKVNDLAPFSMTWTGMEDVVALDPADVDRRITNPAFPLALPATFAAGETTLQADLVIYYCEAEAQELCLIEQVRLLAPVTVAAAGDATLTLAHTIPAP